MSLHKQGDQIGQVRSDGFVDDPENRVKKSEASMRHIAEDYVSERATLGNLETYIATELGNVDGGSRRGKTTQPPTSMRRWKGAGSNIDQMLSQAIRQEG